MNVLSPATGLFLAFLPKIYEVLICPMHATRTTPINFSNMLISFNKYRFLLRVSLNMRGHFHVMIILFIGRVFEGMDVWPLACWDCGLESRWCYDVSLSLSLVSVVEQRSLQRADPSSRGILFSVSVSSSVIRCNNRPVYLKPVTKKEVGVRKKWEK